MALLPEVHVDFRGVTFERIYQVFLPLIPGGVLVAGCVLDNPASISAKAVALGVASPYLLVLILVGLAYMTGWMLYGVSVLTAGVCAGLLNRLVYKKWPPERPNLDSSKSFIFRRVATEFLGESMAFPADNDVAWRDLYNVLQDYVLRKSVPRFNENLLLMLHWQATGWALLYLYLESLMWGHGLILVVSIILTCEGALVPFLINYTYWKYDRLPGWDFIARLIHEIRLSKKQEPAVNQP